MLNKIIHYFSLQRSQLGDNEGVKRELILFSGVLLGTVGHWIFNMLQNNQFAWPGLILGLIAGVVVFPTIYYQAELKRSKVTFVKWCVAFQNGFFWPALFELVGQSFVT